MRSPARTRVASVVATTLVVQVMAVHGVTFAPRVAYADEGKSSSPAAAPPAAKVDLIARGAQLFEDQQYEDSIQVLSAALLRPQNTREEKVEIHRLLALDYITLRRNDESENAVRGLLALDPSYELPKTESPRFRDFFAAARARWEADGRPGAAPDPKADTKTALRHSSPSEGAPGKSVPLRAKLVDPASRVARVVVHYRSGTRGEFSDVAMSRAGDLVTATIPASAVKPPLLEYWLEALAEDGSSVLSRGDATAPLRVPVSDGSRGWILPVAIGGGVLGAAAIVGALALAGVFSGSSPSGNGGPGPAGPGGTSRVVVSVGE
ncbi:MAG: hypothetical protein U0169_12205 [Polyangiaceae bacterium]